MMRKANRALNPAEPLRCALSIGARRARGVSLLESMLMVVILGIVFVGFGVGLTSTARVPGAVDRRLSIHTRLVEKMEDLKSLPFATVAANSGLTDSVSIGNTSYPRTVTVVQIDGDSNGTPDSDLLQITVAIAGQSLKMRMVDP